ncbi:MAG: sulfate adenylyltransferase subunit CysN [Candidatus Angelobacter sp. Gp1-AA117]|nr:MAG: sulfate adenylyltransferase subunit CysN [Candidatus Angelobacter sp. Gp1-AA117]
MSTAIVNSPATALPLVMTVQLHTATPEKSLLRFTTAGSVDDGKSTLIGRLLYDSKAIYEDQITAVQKSGINRSSAPIDLSLFTDGLRAEREQGITIDVAYRYFSTPRRKFIIADTPGHEQYTRNMVTGASTANAAVILIDATKGLLSQSRRHIYLSALLGIDHVIAAVNKMDLAGYDQNVFQRVEQEFQAFCRQFGIRNTCVIPVSALQGENVVEHGEQMQWYDGPTLLELLENIPDTNAHHSAALRFPVQYVIRPDAAFRGFAGRVCAGTLRPGAAVVALPSGVKSRIKSIISYDGELDSAGTGRSITITLEDEIDLGRGDLLACPDSMPQVGTRLQANLVWLHSDQMRPGKTFLLKHTGRTMRATVSSIQHCIDINSFSTVNAATTLRMNDIASVILETTQPLYFDPYQQNRTMGSFILIDPMHNATVAAGMIVTTTGPSSSSRSHGEVQLRERILRNGHPPAAVWLVDRPDLAAALEREIFARGWHGQILSDAEFDPHQLKAVARAFRNSGAITVLTISAGTYGIRHEIETIFGSEHFIALSSLPEKQCDALAVLLRHLQAVTGDANENQVD